MRRTVADVVHHLSALPLALRGRERSSSSTARHRVYLDEIFGPHFETRIPICAMTDGILPAYSLLSSGVGAGFLQAHLIGARPDPAVWHAFDRWRREHRGYLVDEAELRADPQLRAKIARVEAAIRGAT